MEDEIESVADLGLPNGPPLHLERPGRAVEVLGAFLQPERVERLRAVLTRRTRHLTVLTERFHDGHNIAACIRSCEAFGIQDLHIVPQEAVKQKMSMMVTTGSHKWLTTHRHASAEAAAAALQARGYRLVVADPPGGHASTPVRDLDLSRPVAIVLGNERDGVSAELRAQSEERLHVPMEGFVESLNVSVACAIALSHLRTRLDDELGESALLTAEEQQDLLDLWVARDVPRVREVVAELVRRESDSESG